MSSLHALLARRILKHIRGQGLPAGHHLTEQSLEPVVTASRSPIRGALQYLADRNILEKRPNRGFFLLQDAQNLDLDLEELPDAPEEQTYLAIARDRLAGKLPLILLEAEIARRYRVTRDQVLRILGRIANEGWIERRPGKGWSFLPMIDSPEAYQESYEFRRTLEPAGLVAPGFDFDSAVLAHLRQQQEALVAGGYLTASDAELFEANAGFHETLAQLSGNRFMARAIAGQNRLRRLVEYQETIQRARVLRQCQQHLEILTLLESRNTIDAATAMAAHLGGARDEKVKILREGLFARPNSSESDGY